MASNITDSNNAFKGGISYTSPPLVFGNMPSAPNSGFSFDLPLATVNNMTNNALGFLAMNSLGNKAFVGGIYETAQDAVSGRADAVTNIFSNALNNQARLADAQNATIPGIWQSFTDTARFFGDRAVDITNAANKGACFITSAICHMWGKPDDCEELTILRKYRDEFMLTNDVGVDLVEQYYDIAPGIVEAIDKSGDSIRCYIILRDKYLLPAIEAVKEGRNDEALLIYTAMVQEAKELAYG